MLDDHVWQPPPLPLTDWISYQPLYGDKIAQRTTVWAAYDARYFYFAFPPQITQQIGFTYVHFERADSGAKVYDVRIVNTRSPTDLLGSYELRPGTVVYAGVRIAARGRALRRGELAPRGRRIRHQAPGPVLQGVVPVSLPGARMRT